MCSRNHINAIAYCAHTLFPILINQLGLARLNETMMPFCKQRRFVIIPFPLRFRSEDTSLPVHIKGTDCYHLDHQNVADFITDKIIDRLHFKPGCEAFLHAVDDGGFGGALLGLLEQALGLVEETAFSRATLIELAIVVSRRKSDSVKASNLSSILRY